jgi:hypothetical protein
MSYYSASNYRDPIRNLLAWIVLIISVSTLLLLKPAVQINQTSMLLPLNKKLSPIQPRDVKLANPDIDYYYSAKKLGFLTVTTPILDDNIHNATASALEQAKKLAADAGGNLLLVYGMQPRPWFDSGKSILRLQAQVLSQ